MGGWVGVHTSDECNLAVGHDWRGLCVILKRRRVRHGVCLESEWELCRSSRSVCDFVKTKVNSEVNQIEPSTLGINFNKTFSPPLTVSTNL